MVKLFNREDKSLDPAKNLRREERFLVNVPVEHTRRDSQGNAQVEHTRIEDVTSVGCRFTTQVEFHRGDIISIRPLAPGQKSLEGSEPQLFEVMWASSLGSRWTAGAKKLEGEKLGSVDLPGANGFPSQTSK